MTLFRPISMSTGSPSLGLSFSPLERVELVVFVVVFDFFNLCKTYVALQLFRPHKKSLVYHPI